MEVNGRQVEWYPRAKSLGGASQRNSRASPFHGRDSSLLAARPWTRQYLAAPKASVLPNHDKIHYEDCNLQRGTTSNWCRFNC